MKLWKTLRSRDLDRVDFCEECAAAVTTAAQRSQRMREELRDEVARTVGRL